MYLRYLKYLKVLISTLKYIYVHMYARKISCILAQRQYIPGYGILTWSAFC